jgi:HK97 family phage portal protein
MNTQGLPKEYIHEANGIQTKFPVSITGQCNLLHMRAPHPTNDFYGLSSVEPAAKSVDLHNEASTHNLALLQNGASPSGAMVFRGNITQEQMPAIEEKLLAKFQGTRNSGKPLVVGGDWTWNQLGLSPKDLDFTEGKLQAAREICTAFGVPHELIVEGNSTYNNKSEAKLMLWDETILPLLDKFNKTVLNWLLSSYGAETRGWFFNYDMDSITALAPRRWMQSQKVLDEWASGLITRDEARARLGHDTVGDKKGGSEFATGNPPQG